MKDYEEEEESIIKYYIMTNYNMAGGNPNYWSMNNFNMHNHLPQPQQALNNSTLLSSSPTSLFSSQYVSGSSSSSLALNPYADNHDHLPQSWSQLLLGGLASDEEKLCLDNLYESKKSENWEDQTLNPSPGVSFVDVNQEISQLRRSNNFYGHGGGDEEFYASSTQSANWSQTVPVSSPRSCVTSLSTNMLDFSHNKADGKTQQLDHSSECNSTATGGVCKKARVQSSSSLPPLKVRKEKLGDRITAIHQIVSPFGKTDTASVLLEAIGYIRFLHGQIEALSSPYLGNASGNMRNQHSVHGERNCIFPEDPGQLLSDNCLKRRGEPNQGSKDAPKDLRSRGLCLVPVSYTQHVGSDNGADYWAPAIGGGF